MSYTIIGTRPSGTLVGNTMIVKHAKYDMPLPEKKNCLQLNCFMLSLMTPGTHFISGKFRIPDFFDGNESRPWIVELSA